MSARRTSSHARSLAAARTVSSVTLVERGPDEGEYQVKWVQSYRKFRALHRLGGEVYSGTGGTEEEAKAEARKLAEELRARKGWVAPDDEWDADGDYTAGDR